MYNKRREPIQLSSSYWPLVLVAVLSFVSLGAMLHFAHAGLIVYASLHILAACVLFFIGSMAVIRIFQLRIINRHRDSLGRTQIYLILIFISLCLWLSFLGGRPELVCMEPVFEFSLLQFLQNLVLAQDLCLAPQTNILRIPYSLLFGILGLVILWCEIFYAKSLVHDLATFDEIPLRGKDTASEGYLGNAPYGQQPKRSQNR